MTIEDSPLIRTNDNSMTFYGNLTHWFCGNSIPNAPYHWSLILFIILLYTLIIYDQIGEAGEDAVEKISLGVVKVGKEFIV